VAVIEAPEFKWGKVAGTRFTLFQTGLITIIRILDNIVFDSLFKVFIMLWRLALLPR